MDNIKFSNNVSVKLASAVSSTDTTITTNTLPVGIAWPDLTVPEAVSAFFYGVCEAASGTQYLITRRDVGTPQRTIAAISWGSVYGDAISGLSIDGMIEGDLGVVVYPTSAAVVKFTDGAWVGGVNIPYEAYTPAIYYASKQCLSNMQSGYVYVGANYASASNIVITTPNPPTTVVSSYGTTLSGYIGPVGLAEYFYITLMQIETGVWEICKCTSYIQNTDDTWTLTIERAQEGSTAADFTDTAVVENRITAGTLDSMVQAINDQIVITDMISQEELQNIRDVADAIEEIGATNIQELIDNANEANETANEAVDSVQSMISAATTAQAAAEAAAVTASTMAAQAEDCRDQSCECATESEAAADDAEAASAAAIAANAAAQNALDQFKNLSVGLNVVQIDPVTEIFVNDPLGVDPASIADDVDGLILDIEDGDYALTLSSETVEVPDPIDPDATITKGTVALYKGTAESGNTYSGFFTSAVWYTSTINTYVLGRTVDGRPDAGVQYVAWSLQELPTEGILENECGLVPSTQTQANASIYKCVNGTWVLQGTRATSDIVYVQKSAFGGEVPTYVALGVNAWVPVIVDTPANAPTSLQDVADNFGNTAVAMTAHSITGLPEWVYVKNLPIDNLTIFSITKPFDNQGNGFYWFRNTWNRLDYTGVGTVQSVDGIQAGTGHDVQLKYSVTKSEFEALQEAGTLIPGARYLVAEEAQSSSSVDNGVPLFSIIDSVSSIAPAGYLDVNVDNGILTQAAFPDAYQQLVNLQSAGDTQILSLEDYAAAITAEGCCRKFGLDTGTQTFRVPFIPLSFWYGQTRVSSTYREAITTANDTSVGQVVYSEVAPSDIYVYAPVLDTTGDTTIVVLVIVENGVDIVQYALHTSEEASATAYVRQGQTWEIRAQKVQASTIYIFDVNVPLSYHFIKVYGSVSDAGTLNLAQLVTQKANKADLVGLGFPSDTFVNLIIPVSGGTVIAPGNGWFTFSSGSTSALGVLYLSTNLFVACPLVPGAGGGVVLPVKEGDVVSVSYSNTNNAFLRFVPAIGSN